MRSARVLERPLLVAILLPMKTLQQRFHECCRQGYYLCGHCSRIGYIGQYHENGVPACPHCKKNGVMEWHAPVVDATCDHAHAHA